MKPCTACFRIPLRCCHICKCYMNPVLPKMVGNGCNADEKCIATASTVILLGHFFSISSTTIIDLLGPVASEQLQRIVQGNDLQNGGLLSHHRSEKEGFVAKFLNPVVNSQRTNSSVIS
eukprot:m.559800 g.559800  ORF g.559800 m.559800 type:complete len:119 (-) comp22208_c0_seq11:3701-4057(-)